MPKTNAAIIPVSEEAILALLQFQGGKVHRVSTKPERFDNTVYFTIEHPDLPELYEGDCMTELCPVYTIHGLSPHAERTYPPKKVINAKP